MDGRQVETGVRYAGQHQVQTLAFATLHALERAGLRDVIDEVKRRVLDRDGATICEITTIDGEETISYKPMVELLLYEIKNVARAPHVSDDDRRVRIEWAMTLAGM